MELVNDPNRTINEFSRDSAPIEFLLKHYQSDPVGCLNEVLKSNCIPFERLFFDVISYGWNSFTIPLPSKPVDKFESIIWICQRVRVIVACLFYQPFYSEKEMNIRISIIRLYMRFAKLYIEYPGAMSSNEYHKRELQELYTHVKAWRFSINYLPIIAPNGKIDYLQFFSFFNRYIRSDGSTLSEYREMDIEYYFVFATLLNQMCEKKDLDIFKIDHPELPFLVGLIIDGTSNFGKNILPRNYRSVYFQYLKDSFEKKTKFKSLASTLNFERYLVELAKKELGLEASFPYSNSLLIESLERIPHVCQSKGYHNILWQLKGYTFIKQFLASSGFHKLIKKL
jgi:hypothetical protein